jgi:hypothetical protein
LFHNSFEKDFDEEVNDSVVKFCKFLDPAENFTQGDG